jgi:hypothetical protein
MKGGGGLFVFGVILAVIGFLVGAGMLSLFS